MNIKFQEIQTNLLALYDGGQAYEAALFAVTGVRKTNYTRQQARELITAFLDKHAENKDKVHPIFTLEARQVMELCTHLTDAANGKRIEIDPGGPCVY